MNSKRILSLVLAMVLAVSLCLPGTTAYAIEPEDDDLESEQVIPTEPALCSYTSNENDRHADNVTLSEAVGVLNENGGGTITVTRSGLASNGSSAILNLEVEQDITIVAEENRPVTVTLTEPMFMMDCQGNADGKLTLGQEGMTSGLLTFDGVQKALCFARSNWRNTYVIGYSDGNVRPNANVSRAETATIFFRLLNADIRDGNLTAENTFTDVVDGQWCNKSVSTMAKLGIVKGRTAEIFDPYAPITRAEFAVICARFDTKQTNGNNNFSDISGHWAEAEIKRAAALGWIAGYPDGTFRPNDYITRAQAMTMIDRVLCRMPQDEEDLLGSMVVWPDNKPTDWHYLAVQEATNSHDFKRKGEVGEKWTKLTSAPDWTKYQ